MLYSLTYIHTQRLDQNGNPFGEHVTDNITGNLMELKAEHRVSAQ